MARSGKKTIKQENQGHRDNKGNTEFWTYDNKITWSKNEKVGTTLENKTT